VAVEAAQGAVADGAGPGRVDGVAAVAVTGADAVAVSVAAAVVAAVGAVGVALGAVGEALGAAGAVGVGVAVAVALVAVAAVAGPCSRWQPVRLRAVKQCVESVLRAHARTAPWSYACALGSLCVCRSRDPEIAGGA
jgi:hypothetical protein